MRTIQFLLKPRVMMAISMLLFGLCFASCKRCKKCTDFTNPACENYDHCWDKKTINADFTMKEVISYRYFDGNLSKETYKEFLPEADSIYDMAEFEPKTKYYDSLKWYIGAEVLTDRIVRRKGFFLYQNIPITLVVYYTSFTDCTKDDGIDSVTKILYSVGQFEEIPISGVYEGYNTDEPTKTFIIEVNDTTNEITLPTSLGNFTRSGNIQNLPNGSPVNNRFAGREVFNWGGENFKSWVKEPTLIVPSDSDPDNAFILNAEGFRNGENITINYSYDNIGYQKYLNSTSMQGLQIVSKTFVGKKIKKY